MTIEERRKTVYESIIRNPVQKPDDNAPIYQKIKWLNSYNLSVQKIVCTDKLAVKDYVKAQVGDLVKTAKVIQVFNDVSEIDLNNHPNSFWIKRNIGCAKNIFIQNKDTFDKIKIQQSIDNWNKEIICGLQSKEYQYALSEPVVFSEESLLGKNQTSLVDYRFWVFHNRVEFVAMNGGRGFGGQVFYDRNFNKIDLYNAAHISDCNDSFPKPKNFQTMIEIAEQLSTAFMFVRVDLFNIDGVIYLGELTFSPGGYLTRFVNSKGESLDVEIGRKLKIW